jgi:pyruvate/2-oxoglutarate dehydrogenase complex dihydrolipoamide dehydrogenase (E3) component
MTLYDVAPQILGTFDRNLSAYATKKFARRGIQIKVSRVEKKQTKGCGWARINTLSNYRIWISILNKTGRHVTEVKHDRLMIKDEGEGE